LTNNHGLKSLFANVAHVRTFKLCRDDSSAVTFVPRGPTKPRIFCWTFQLLAGFPSKDLLALAFTRGQVQGSFIHALFASASCSGTDSAHVRALVFDLMVLIAVRFGISPRVRKPTRRLIRRRADFLQTSRASVQRGTHALARADIETSAIVADLAAAIAQPIDAFAGAFLADFPVVSGRRVRCRSDGVALGPVVAHEIVASVRPIGDFGAPDRRAPEAR